MNTQITPHEDAPDEPSAEAPAEPPVRERVIAGVPTTSRRTTITFYLPEGLRTRARAAFRSTSFDEQDSSWSEMMNKALLAEVQRREDIHNAGQVFPGSDDPLTPGRPIHY
ncbi:hypothetical protein [Leifsonia sp. NPDC058230]|uniref:ParB family protein n=1 Tax=Leifsonia sp. NPDC058230 TaxID=3346391 RepID=UPI0036DEA1E5